MQTRASLQVRTDLLAENVAKIRDLAPAKEIIAMVKANGYGHGAIPISQNLIENNIKILGVASLAEGLELRQNLSDTNHEIYVFSDTQLSDPENISFYTDFRLTPVLSSLNDLRLFLNESNFSHCPLLLKFNTGMNRLGLSSEDVSKISKLILMSGRKTIAHVMTHFACASQDIKLAHNTRQQENFATVLKEIKACGLNIDATSISNSGAIEQGTGLEYSHIRPGLILYGPSSLIPGLKSDWNGKIISSLKVRVLETRVMRKGDPVGYGLTPIHRDGLLLVAAIGYGDGFNNRYQKSHFNIKNQRGESLAVDVVGRVNMDMVQLLAPIDSKVQVGEIISFWDDDPHTLNQICQSSKTIPYEVFCQLSVRVPRIFKLT